MTDEEIFDLADQYGWMDDFGRWNFKETGLIKFALALLKAEREAENQYAAKAAVLANLSDRIQIDPKTGNLGIGSKELIAEAENVSVNTPSSEDLPEIEEKHEFFCPRCGHCCRECVGLTARQRAALDELARIDAELGL